MTIHVFWGSWAKTGGKAICESFPLKLSFSFLINEYQHSVCTLISFLKNGVASMSVLFLPAFIFSLVKPDQMQLLLVILASDYIFLRAHHWPTGFNQIWTFVFFMLLSSILVICILLVNYLVHLAFCFLGF